MLVRAAAVWLFLFALTGCNGPGSQSSSVALSAASYSVAQNAGSVSIAVNRSGDAAHVVSVSYQTSGGTASPGTDYTSTSGTLQWAENDMTAKTITVPVSNATAFSGSRSFDLTLTDPSGNTSIGNPGSATVTITGDAAPTSGNLVLSASSYTVAQNAGTLTITVNRVDGSSGAVTVSYATANGTAMAGMDYTAASGQLQWADGDASSKTFSVAISNVTGFTGTKTFSVALSSPTGGAGVSTPGSANVTINGNGSPAVGSLSLSAASDSVNQGAGSVMITVNRTGGSSSAISVNYATADGTATAGADYSATSGTLQWADGDANPKTFTVAISNATAFTGNKTFTVTLSKPSAGTSISSPGTATVTIAGSAGPGVGSLAFSSSTYTVAQTAGSLTVTVTRTGGSTGAVGISYSTANGTAVAGTDYTTANGTLQWADGETSAKTFTVAVSQATPFAGNKSFTVTLATPTGGVTLSTPNTADVTIAGSASSATGSLQLFAATYAITQSAGVATVTVNRTGGSSGAISVAYATSNGTAVAGTDYTAASGTLNWASGDANSKAFTVAISNATPFSGAKEFNVTLSNPGGGATLGSPTSATVTINGSGGGSGGPAAVGNLQLVNQGGPGNNKDSSANSLSNYQAISWTAATAGANPIAKYNIYRNGALYATQTAATVFSGYIAGNTLTVTSVSSGTVLPGVRYSAPGLLPGTLINTSQTSGTPGKTGTYPVNNAQTLGNSGSPVTFTAWVYIDTNAANSNSPGTWSAPCNIYTYDVTAVDSQGTEGPHAAQFSAWGYQNGFSNWNNLDLSYGGVIENYASSAGNPKNGYDISLSFPSGGFQPTADAMQAPEWDLEIGAFNYFTVDLNPGSNVNFQTSLSIVSRLPPGDVYSWHGISDIWPYGAAPKANTWATYKVPLASVLGVGTSTFTGSISGTTLTVTAVLSGAVGVDAGGYVTGPGVPAGTYITGFAQKASVGTFTIAGPGVTPSLSVPSETMSFQRTSLYKLTMQPNANVTFYVDNLGFETN